MKRLILIFSLILLLTACGKQEQVPAAPEVSEEVEVTEEVTDTEPTVEVETTVVPEKTEIVTGDEPAVYTSETVEGLIEDTVGYVLEVPTFEVEGAEQIRAYYEKLAAHLEDYTKETVYTEAASRACIVSVYGEVTEAALDGDTLTVTYAYRCDFSDTEESTENVRTDVFSAATGEKIEN